ncbi:MAG TPA: hypothetical protein VIX73_15755 [Kofleriaceae bacterium]|jgi:hypothetical protein
MAIESIHWGDVGDRSYHGDLGRLMALWPDPVDHDACLERAGFERFADTDAPWDADFAIIIQDVLDALGTYGSPVVTAEPIVQRPLIDRLLRKPLPRLRLSEQIALVAHDDQFGACTVAFGSPIRAVVHVSDGHPILWMWLHHDVANAWQDHLNAVVRGRNLIKTTLRWDVLLPEWLFSS